MPKKTHKLQIDPQNDDFGAILNCAVRYACGRQTYMPSIVISFITPLLPVLNDKTLWCFDQDLTDAKYFGGYGHPLIDEPDWMRFLDAVRAERTKRGHELYKSHWEPRISDQTRAALKKIGRVAHGEEEHG